MSARHRCQIGLALAAALLSAIAVLVLTGGVRSPFSSPEARIPATVQQRQKFFDLIQRYHRIYFDGWTTGNTSRFATVLYNDPAEKLDANSQQELNRQRNKVAALLANIPKRPGEGQTGFLSAQLAEVLDRRQSVQLWNAAQAKAASEGRRATLDDMPNGRIPVFAPQQWVEKKMFITQAIVNGDRATAVYVFDNPDSPLLYHVNLIQVEGNWYITKKWVTGNP